MKNERLDRYIKLVDEIVSTLDSIQFPTWNDEASKAKVYIRDEVKKWFSTRQEQLHDIRDNKYKLPINPQSREGLEDLPHLHSWFDTLLGNIETRWGLLKQYLPEDDDDYINLYALSSQEMVKFDRDIQYFLAWILHLEGECNLTNNLNVRRNNYGVQCARRKVWSQILRTRRIIERNTVRRSDYLPSDGGNNPSARTDHYDPQLSRGYGIAVLLRY